MIDFAELFAFCDLHANRRIGRPSMHEFVRLASEAGEPVLAALTALRYPQYYDRQGFPIPAEPDASSSEPAWMLPTLRWAAMKQDRNYTIVARDDLPDGSYLSTVWLGLDHNYGWGGPPMIFETMRFSGESSEAEMPGPLGGGTIEYHPSMEFPDPFGEPGETTEQLRYTTEEEALAAHHEIMRRLVLREGH